MGRRTLLLLMAVVLSLAAVTPVIAAPRFTDVPEGHIFYDDIEWLAAMEITQGCNPPVNDFYCPASYVNRGQMAAFLVRALDLTDNGGGDHFTDDDGSVFESAIDKLYTAGITQGCNPPTNDHYCPNSYVTRGQMAAFLRRGLDLPPPAVTGVIATGNGPDEIAVYWNTSPDLDVDHYNVWHSYVPGWTKAPIVNPLIGPEPTTGDRWWVVVDGQFPDPGYDCFQVSAVDMAGQEGPRSAEACFDLVAGAPAQVTGVTVGTGGGSGEAYVSWTPNSDGDTDYYNVWFSEFPGGTYLFEAPVDHSVRNGLNRVFYVDWPVDQTVGKTCYVIAAVDLSGNGGPLSAEACFAAP